MNKKLVKDIMLPLSEYAVVGEDATLSEALQALEDAQMNLPKDRQHNRAVLVKNKKGKIIGKLGHLGFLKALEPKYNSLGNVEQLSRAGVNLEFLEMMMDNLRFWQDDLNIIYQRARSVRIRDVMKPTTENISENSTLAEAIHHIIMWQVLSMLVTRDDEVVGILRLSDLFEEVSLFIREPNATQDQ